MKEYEELLAAAKLIQNYCRNLGKFNECNRCAFSTDGDTCLLYETCPEEWPLADQPKKFTMIKLVKEEER